MEDQTISVEKPTEAVQVTQPAVYPPEFDYRLPHTAGFLKELLALFLDKAKTPGDKTVELITLQDKWTRILGPIKEEEKHLADKIIMFNSIEEIQKHLATLLKKK